MGDKLVIFFSGSNCVKCKSVKKFWNEVTEEMDTYSFCVVNTDIDLTDAYKYKVMALPTFLIVDTEGKEIARISGEVSKKILQDFLEKHK